MAGACAIDVGPVDHMPTEDVRHAAAKSPWLQLAVDVECNIQQLSAPTRWLQPDLDRFVLLSGIRARMRAGTLTLVLAPPGHGKTALLRVLASAPHVDGERLAGTLTYGGHTVAQLRGAGVHPERVACMAPQTDAHIPQLTVRETLDFAAENALPESLGAWVPGNGFETMSRTHYVDHLISELGLGECQHTIVGDETARGISGGQRKRVTIAEALVPRARVLCLDEITTGLDSALALQVMRFIREKAIHEQLTAVVALQQPASELLQLFDQVLCLRWGKLDFAGAPAQLEAHYTQLFGARPQHLELADWVVRLLHGEDKPQGAGSTPPTEAAVDAGQAPPTRDAADAAASASLHLTDPAWAWYRRKFARTTQQHLLHVLQRQARLIYRNHTFIAAHIVQALVVGLVLGFLFRHPSFVQFSLKLSVVVFGTFTLAFANMPEVGIVTLTRRIVANQRQAGMYPSISYAFAQAAAHVPIAVVEVCILASCTYWLVGFNSDATRFVFFLLAYFLTDLVASTLFRLIALLSSSAEAAQIVVAPITGILILFEGFLVTRGKIPDWLIWLYWLSPFSWLLRSIAQNEFLAPDSEYSTTPPLIPEAYGVIYMNQFEIQVEAAFRWGGIIYLTCILVLLQVAVVAATARLPSIPVRGTRRLHADASRIMTADRSAPTAMVAHAEDTAVHHPETAASGVTLGFRGISYWVPSRSGNYHRLATTQSRKSILREVTAYARPATLTAIVGESGSGKTTLLDVLAGFKPRARVSGEIFVNGHLIPPGDVPHFSGYVQQNDVHLPTATVREAVLFAARLRRAPTDAQAPLGDHVNSILETVGLLTVADARIGTVESPTGLSPSQRKKLTIAVELAAGAKVLFLDEPTSGLDALSAAAVVALLRKLATTAGLTVLCTIHQPSGDMFLQFDNVLCLSRNGRQVYFGPVGPAGGSVLEHFHAAAGSGALPVHGANPASWILDAIARDSETQASSAVTNADSHTRLENAYALSESKRKTDAEMGEMCTRQGPDDFLVPARGRPRTLSQLTIVMARTWQAYCRDWAYNGVRFIVFVLLGLLFGLLYYHVDMGVAGGIQSALAMYFVALGFCGMIHFGAVMQVMMRQRAIVHREVQSHTYAPTVHTIAHLLTEVPYVLFLSLAFAIIFYFMVGGERSASAFFHFFAVLWIFSLAYNALGIWFAGLFSNVASAQAVGYFVQSILFLFGGLFVQRPAIPSGALWIYYINPLHYACDAVWIKQFYCNFRLLGSRCPSFFIVPLPYVFDRWSFIADFLGLAPGPEWWYLGVLVAFYAAYSIGAVVTHRYVSYVQR